MPFSEKDAPFFFGREQERKIISANLRTRRLTLLYGPSGVGKSSVINAGVVYHLRQRAKQQMSPTAQPTVALAGDSKSPGRLHLPSLRAELIGQRKPAIVIVFSVWGGDPLESLQAAIIAGLKESQGNVLQPEAEKKLRALKLTEMLEEVIKSAEGAELLIILDQFEEYFVYHPTDEGPGKFDDEFSRAIVNLDLHANFLISIREDWLARLDRFKGRIPNLFENSIRIDHLDREAAHEAIFKPIEKYNELIRQLGDGQRPEVVITDDFISEVLDQLERLDESYNADPESASSQRDTKSAERRIQTSRIQIVLQYLWDKVRNDSPPTFGLELLDKPDTAKQIIQSNLKKTLKYLSSKEKMIAAKVFPFLITEAGTKIASTAAGLALRSDLPPEEIRALLTKLSRGDVRILNQIAPPPGQPTQVRYELTSDVLAIPALEWAKDLPKQRSRVVLLRFFIGFLVIVIAVITAAFLRARQQRQVANEQRRIAENALRDADEQRSKAERVLDVVRRLQDERIPYSKAVLRGHGGIVTSAVFTADGHVLTASADGSAILWDIETAKSIREFSKDEKGLVCAASSPKDNIVVTASTDGSVTLWNVATGGSTQLRERVGKHITDITFSPTGEFIAAGNTTGEVIVWNTATGEQIKEITGKGKAIKQVAFSPQGKFLAAASDDHTVRVWWGVDWSDAKVLEGHTEKVNGLAFSPDEKLIATASADTTVRVWNLSTGSSRIFRGHTASVNSVSFNHDGQRILSASDDTTARIWHLDSEKSIQLIGHTDKVLSASFSSNGMQVVTGSKDNTARIWSAITGTSLRDLLGHLNEITYVSFSWDGKFALTASDDATARVWSAPEPGSFEIDQSAIGAIPRSYSGPCPVTISFLVSITALNGSGTVLYRFVGSDGKSGPVRNMFFDKPGTKYVNFYWKISGDYNGSETIEIIEPKGIKSAKAKFMVRCNKTESAPPEPKPSPTATPPG
jgi:WD40 repeat protein